MTILKEKVIVLTSYERKSLVRFLTLYLSSVFVLLAIIGYLFFEHNKDTMKSAMKFEMMYQSRMLFSDIVVKAMLNVQDGTTLLERESFLKSLKHCRFKVGYYDEDGKTIFTEIQNNIKFNKGFYVLLQYCGDGSIVAEVERGMKLDERILQYQTVKLSDDADPEGLKAIVEKETQDKETAAAADVSSEKDTEPKDGKEE